MISEVSFMTSYCNSG